MSVLWLLVGCSVLVAVGFLAAFIWAVRSGQYDDRFTPSVRMLFEDQKKIRIMDENFPTTSEGSRTHGDADHTIR